ncbi:hypothetical protein [Metamycoplasma gateae]|uniref:Uncharacterized protein n=1 Tax=Metamycoplasma gateae TaxID=35769 RepID=A0ABZ2AG73_9BACT|nr:hypothetical protein V2E26_01825 [Metamycoplasma gateae]
MKKSSKILIGLSILTAATALTVTATTIVLHTKDKKDNKLEKEISKFKQELETNKDLTEYQRKGLLEAIAKAEKVLNSKESTKEEIQKALETFLAETSHFMSTKESEKDVAKRELISVINLVKEYIKNELSDAKYSSIKETLEQKIAEIEPQTTADDESKTEELYTTLKNELNSKLAEAKETKELEDTKALYTSKLAEAKEVLNQITEDKYQSVKTNLESIINEIETSINATSTKENYDEASKTLQSAIDEANAEKAKIDEEIALKEASKESYEAKITEVETYISQDLEDEKYKEIKDKLQGELDKVKTEVQRAEESNKTVEFYTSKTESLTTALEEAKTSKNTQDDEEAKKAQAKESYDSKSAVAEEFKKSLEGDLYADIKTTFENELTEAKSGITDTSTSEELTSATEKISAAIQKATDAKSEKDQEVEAEAEAKRTATENFNTLKTQVEEYINTKLTDKEEDKTALENELNTQKAKVEEENSTSASISEAIQALQTKFDEIKAKNAEEKPVENETENEAENTEEELTEEQKAIVEMINNKTILKMEVSDQNKQKINELSNTVIPDNIENRHFFGYIKLTKKDNSLSFGPKSKTATIPFTAGLFDEKFVNMLKSKEIEFPGDANSSRKALSFDKKTDGKIVIPFRFNGKTTIYEIELF